MYLGSVKSAGENTSQERRNRSQPDSRVLGRVIACDGARATLAAYASHDGDVTANLWAVGRLISINLGTIRTVGLVYAIEAAQMQWKEDDSNHITVHVELVGEVRDNAGSRPSFERGVTHYPHIGAIAHRIRASDLETVHDLAGRQGLTIGQLSQDEAIAARIAIDDMLERHFAIVGTTGVGKSTAVSLLLRKAIEARPELRVLILDPHNEFSRAFPDKSIRINGQTLDLPFWLFRLEEFVEVLFRGRSPIAEEVDILRDIIPAAKQKYANPSASGLMRRSSDLGGITADTPIPYLMTELLNLLDERMGLLESKHDRPTYRSLRVRIASAINDPRYRFMFASRVIEDNLHETIGRIFRVPLNGVPITCFEMAGLPSEVVNSVCSVLARIAFDLALGSDGRMQLLVLCEEAHRYMPADPSLGFAPTRHSLSRIAKEGRKYGCYLGVVTQRPGDLDPTVLSQCSTVFAMRLANENDQAIIRSAVADSSASTLSFLSSMGQREAIAFGEGVATTMRMKFQKLDRSQLPAATEYQRRAEQEISADIDLAGIIERMRNRVSPTGQLDHHEATELPNGRAETHSSAHDPMEEPDQDRRRDMLRRRFQDDGLRRLYE